MKSSPQHSQHIPINFPVQYSLSSSALLQVILDDISLTKLSFRASPDAVLHHRIKVLNCCRKDLEEIVQKQQELEARVKDIIYIRSTL